MQRKKKIISSMLMGLVILLLSLPAFAALGAGEETDDDVLDDGVQVYESFILVDFGATGPLLDGKVQIEIELADMRFSQTFNKNDLLVFDEDKAVYQVRLSVKDDLQAGVEESKRQEHIGAQGKGRAVWTDNEGIVTDLPWISFKTGDGSSDYRTTLHYKMIGKNTADTGEWFEGTERFLPLKANEDAKDAESAFNQQYLNRMETIVEQQAPASQVIRVFLDGAPVTFDVPPQIVNGSTVVPVRALFEALGYQVAFESQLGRITASLEENGVWVTQIAMHLKDVMLVKWPDSESKRSTIEMPLAPMIIEGRTLIPLRAFSEAVGYEVQWNGQARVITLTKAVTQ